MAVAKDGVESIEYAEDRKRRSGLFINMKTWKIPLLLSYISVASSSCAMITPAFPQIEKTWRVGDSQVASLVSVFLIGYFIGQLVYGPIANRFGRLFALRAGLILNLFGIVFAIFFCIYFFICFAPKREILYIGKAT